ncbi:hypothetical protein B0H14DRAFT_2652870 [Mycena olivaceomarginata]|nr:hypothetical protein B0H14DRAFT_2652870 [Mycena olivaceomarginata]
MSQKFDGVAKELVKIFVGGDGVVLNVEREGATFVLDAAVLNVGIGAGRRHRMIVRSAPPPQGALLASPPSPSNSSPSATALRAGTPPRVTLRSSSRRCSALHNPYSSVLSSSDSDSGSEEGAGPERRPRLLRVMRGDGGSESSEGGPRRAANDLAEGARTLIGSAGEGATVSATATGNGGATAAGEACENLDPQTACVSGDGPLPNCGAATDPAEGAETRIGSAGGGATVSAITTGNGGATAPGEACENLDPQ